MDKHIEYLVFDVETTGLPRNWKAPASKLDNWPRIVQIGWLAFDRHEQLLESNSHIIKPAGFEIPAESVKVHNISNDFALSNGEDIENVLAPFASTVKNAGHVIAHNLSFDEKVVRSELIRAEMEDPFDMPVKVCTKEKGTDICRIPGKYGYKWPTLDELYRHFFDHTFEGAHDALDDAKATAACFFELKKAGAV